MIDEKGSAPKLVDVLRDNEASVVFAAANALLALGDADTYQLPILTISPVENRIPSLKSDPFNPLSQECK